MRHWQIWWDFVQQMRPAFSRSRTFMWFVLSLAGICCRRDLMGVTSIVRVLGLKPSCYHSLLQFFHSKGICLDKLTQIWTKLVLDHHPGILRFNDRIVLVADGIKKHKSGKKMPSVKSLHQESESNTKAEYIMGHSCQSVGVLAQTCNTVFCIPIISRIHEGIIESNRDKRTLMDKLIAMIIPLQIADKFYLVADAYYGNQKIINGLLDRNQHLVCRARSNAVAFEKPEQNQDPKKRGRKKKYGNKVKLREYLGNNLDNAQIVDSPVYGEKGVKLKVLTKDLIAKQCGRMIRFVMVKHPTRGEIVLFTTDLSLDPLDVIEIYGLRFKIEVSFKQAIWTLGTYSYRFWMRDMEPTKRNEGNRFLHRKSKKYRDNVHRKIRAFHVHIQVGTIAQGMLLLVSALATESIWIHFGSWIRTVRPGNAPSEMVASVSLRNSLPEYLSSSILISTFAKFLLSNLDLDRKEGLLLAS